MQKRILGGWLLALILWPCYAGPPVVFEDQRLKEAVEAALGIPDPTTKDMLGLLSLHARGGGIRSISGLEHAVNLQDLDLAYNQIMDISALAGLSKLVNLELYNNQIRDFSPIAGMSNLKRLDIHFNPTKDLSFLTGLRSLEYLVIHNMDLTDIWPLANLTSLTSLDIYDNRISDLSPLAGLTSLECLYAGTNLIRDISSLAGLSRLKTLSLSCNSISDISPLAGLGKLESLNLFANAVTDISPLVTLRSLRMLNLSANPLGIQACQVHLPVIKANNPHLVLYIDSCWPQTSWTLQVACGSGGVILSPSEGTFEYADGQVVYLRARANEGFSFLRWTGTIESTNELVTLTMDRDHQVRAEFVPIGHILYVDDDSPNDPGPGDIGVSDPLEDGSLRHPYDSIQEAVEVVRAGGMVVVRPGVYREDVDCLGRSISLVGYDVNSCGLEMYPVIIGRGPGAVVRVGGLGVDVELRGFIITRGYEACESLVKVVGGRCRISHCVIAGHYGVGGGLVCEGGYVRVSQSTVVDNIGVGGIVVVGGYVEVDSSIVWGNRAGGIVIRSGGCGVRYSDVEGWVGGEGNMDVDPLFVRRGIWDEQLYVMGDYHLRSVGGRWDPGTGGWVIDGVHSPCIDAGDPGRAVGCEPEPNGGRVNMGAYGGTAQASRSRFGADVPVYFSDIRLKEAVEAALGVVDPTASDMLGLISLTVGYKYIEDLTGLEYAKNLEELVLNDNRIRSLGPLSGLSKLRRLDVSDNYVLSDIRGISGLVSLEELDLHRNSISDVRCLGGLVGLRRLVLRDNVLEDVSGLGGLINLEELVLRVNGIRDISGLVGLRRLRLLDLSSNPLGDKAYCEDLWEISRGNSGLYPWYDANPRGPSWVDASDGVYVDRVRIRWAEVCNGPLMITRYRVYRSLSEAGQMEAISGWQMGLEYDDTSAAGGVKYYYWVQAAPYGDGSGAGQISGPDVGWR